MNWDMIGAIAELMAAMGVIASLIYVAMQMKQSNMASRVESKIRMTEKMVDFQNMIIENPRLNKIMIKGRQGLDGLSRDEYLEFSNLALKACWFMSVMFFMRQNKATSNEDWHEHRSIIIYWTNSVGFEEWWHKMGNMNFAGEFKRYIESEVAKGKRNRQTPPEPEVS